MIKHCQAHGSNANCLLQKLASGTIASSDTAISCQQCHCSIDDLERQIEYVGLQLVEAAELTAVASTDAAAHDRVRRWAARLVGHGDPDPTGVPDASPRGLEPTAVNWKPNPSDIHVPTTCEHDPSLPEIPGYELIGPIGQGGMGVVYKARHIRLQRLVALKMITPAGDSDPSYIQRFQAEASAAAQLDHPGIVQVYDVGEHAGRHYFSMALVEGQNLSQLVAIHPLAEHRAAELALGVAEAISVAHAHGLIHRDLKPANVLIDAEGKPRITDFGLAKSITGESDLTVTGQILGTPSYMPPEQATGDISQVREAADIYSIGAILYCLVTGRPPFQAASSFDTLRQVIEQEPVAPRRLNGKVSRDVETICLKCLEKDATRRYPTAVELAKDLRRFLVGEPIAARPVGSVEKTWRWCRRKPIVAGLIATIALVMVLGTTIASYFAIQASAEAKLALAESIRADAKAKEAITEKNRANAAAADAARHQYRAEEALQQARVAQADMQTNLGMQAVREGQQDRAALWFAVAAASAEHDPDRAWSNQKRARNWLKEIPQPVAGLQIETTASQRLVFHPANTHLLTEPDSPHHDTAIWDLGTQLPVNFPVGYGKISAAAWDLRGEHVALANREGQLFLCEFPGLQEVRRVQIGERGGRIALSRQGHIIAAAADNKLWVQRIQADDTETNSPDLTPTPMMLPATAMTIGFSPDGDYLVVTTWKKHLLVFDLQQPDLTPIIEGEHRYVNDVGEHRPQFNIHGQLVTVEGDYLVWRDLDSRQEIRRQQVKGIWGFLVNPTDETIAVGKPSGVELVGPAASAQIEDQESSHLAWISGSHELLTAGRFPQARRLNVDTLEGTDAAMFQSDGFRSLSASPDGQMVAAQGYNKKVRVWSWPQPDQRITTIQGVDASDRGRFNLDSSQFLIRRTATEAQVYSTKNFQPLGPPLQPAGRFLDALFHPRLGEIITLSEHKQKGLVSFLDTRTGKPAAASIELDFSPRDPSDSWHEVVATDANGRRLAVMGQDGKVAIIDLASRAIEKTIETGSGVSIALLDSEPLLLAWHASGNSHVVAYSLGDGKQIYDIKAGGSLPGLVVADWQELVAIKSGNTLRLHDVKSGEMRCAPIQHPNRVDDVIFSANQRFLLTACADLRYRVWDVLTQQQVGPTLPASLETIGQFVAGDRAVLTVDLDGLCRVLDLKTGQLLLREISLPPNKKWRIRGGRRIVASPDGRLAAISGPAQQFVLRFDELVAPITTSPDDLLAWTELASQRTIQHGKTANFDTDEWFRRWALRSRLRDAMPSRLVAAAEPAPRRAMRLSMQARWKEAASVARHGLEQSPDDLTLLHLLARAEANQARDAAATNASAFAGRSRAAYESIVRLQPDYFLAVTELTQLLHEFFIEEPGDFATALKAASQLNPRLRLAVAYLAAGELGRARDWLQLIPDEADSQGRCDLLHALALADAPEIAQNRLDDAIERLSLEPATQLDRSLLRIALQRVRKLNEAGLKQVMSDVVTHGAREQMVRLAAANPTLFNAKKVQALFATIAPDARQVATSWRYTTTAPDESWITTDFDDSRWSVGLGAFGNGQYEYGPIRTKWKTQDIWLRRHFYVGQVPNSASLVIAYDDESIVFLNGVRLGGGSTYTSYRTIPLEALARTLQAGENVLAIRCRNSGGSASFIDAGIFAPLDSNEWNSFLAHLQGRSPDLLTQLRKLSPEVSDIAALELFRANGAPPERLDSSNSNAKSNAAPFTFSFKFSFSPKSGNRSSDDRSTQSGANSSAPDGLDETVTNRGSD